MKRSRRRLIGWMGSAAVHLFAFAVLTPVVAPHVRSRFTTFDDPTIQVQIVRLRDGLGRTTPKAPDPLEALKPTAPGDPQPPPPPPVPPPEPEDASGERSVVAQDSPYDLEQLYRAPFRDASAQASAALRAGLSCEHVDLQQLPEDLLAACVVANGRARTARQPPTKQNPPVEDRGADLRA